MTSASDALVTVVIPTHSRRHLLPRTLRSALGQQDVQVEVVVVDDGSSDGTEAYLEDLDDPRVRSVRHEQARGVCAARNSGIAEARGRWLAFLDDDDLWAPTKLARQLQAMADDGEARWSSAGTFSVDERLRPLAWQADLPGRDVRRELLSDNQVPGGGSGVVADRLLVEEIGGFDEQLHHPGDWDLWLALALRSPVAVVRGPMLAYLRHAGSMSRGTDDLVSDLERMRTKYAAERDELGVRWPDDYWMRYVAEIDQASGNRRAALAAQLRIFARHRHWSWLPRGLAGVVAPGLTGRAVDWWQARKDGCPGLEETAWLDVYRSGP